MDQNFNNDQNNFNNQPIDNQNFNQGTGVTPQPVNQMNNGLQQQNVEQPVQHQPILQQSNDNSYNTNSSNQEPKKSKLGLIILILIVVVAIVAGVILLASKGNRKDGSNQNATENNASNSVTEQTPQNSEEKVEYEYNYISQNKYYINYKRSRTSLQKHVSYVYRGIDDIVQLIYYEENSFDGTLKGIFNSLSIIGALDDIDLYFNADFSGNNNYTIVREKEETIEINGIETIKFEGYVLDHQSKNIYVYGYAYIFNEKPNILIGYVADVNEKETLKSSIKKEIDTMMQSVRLER